MQNAIRDIHILLFFNRIYVSCKIESHKIKFKNLDMDTCIKKMVKYGGCQMLKNSELFKSTIIFLSPYMSPDLGKSCFLTK